MSISHRVAALACLCTMWFAPVEAKAPAGMESALDSSVASMRMNPTQHWYGCYMLGKKVGHGRIWVGPPAPGERGAIATEMEIWMTIQAGAVSNPMRVLERRLRSRRVGPVGSR